MMRVRRPRTILAVLLLALPACSEARDDDDDDDAERPASLAMAGKVVLSPTAFESAGIRVEPVRVAEAPTAAVALEVPGQVEFDPSRVAVISPRAAGRLERMTAVPGERARSGEAVAYVSSPHFVAAQSDLVQAARRAQILEGTPDEEGARALLGAARQRLLLLGGTAADVTRLLQGSEPLSLLPVRSPVAGTILEALAQPGIAVEAGTPIYRIADLGVVQVVAQVPERALAHVRTGTRAGVVVMAYPARRFDGVVTHILEELEPETRTGRVVVRVANPDHALKAGMFATVRIDEIDGTGYGPGASPALMVPARALLAEGAHRFLFVEVAPRTFERRMVQIAEAPAGAAPGDLVVVVAGLSAGERVVVHGAIVLRSELVRGSLADPD
jgi:RND family efflux transporter MFP subunit